MKSTLKMVLSIDANKTVTYSLADPKPDLTRAAVQAVLEELISKQAIIVSGSYAKAVKEVYIHNVEDQQLA